MFSAVAFRDVADTFRVLEVKVRCETVVMDGFFRFLVAVAKHLLETDMAIAASKGVS